MEFCGDLSASSNVKNGGDIFWVVKWLVGYAPVPCQKDDDAGDHEQTPPSM